MSAAPDPAVETSTDVVWTGSTPTNCTINGRHGQVTGVWPSHHRIDAVFVKLDDGPMLHCPVVNVPGEDNKRRVVSAREVDRDEFDAIIGADEFRRSCGWWGTAPLPDGEAS